LGPYNRCNSVYRDAGRVLFQIPTHIGVAKEIRKSATECVTKVVDVFWEHDYAGSSPATLIMKREELLDLVNQNLSTRDISSKLNISQTNVRYWLDKFNIKTNKQKEYTCGSCGEKDSKKFYGNKKAICGKCHNKYTIKKGRENRLKGIAYLGRECKACGYKKFSCSFDFHHTDPSKKDPNYQCMRGWSWERTKKELDKCILLCRNCHMAVHCREIEL